MQPSLQQEYNDFLSLKASLNRNNTSKDIHYFLNLKKIASQILKKQSSSMEKIQNDDVQRRFGKTEQVEKLILQYKLLDASTLSQPQKNDFLLLNDFESDDAFAMFALNNSLIKGKAHVIVGERHCSKKEAVENFLLQNNLFDSFTVLQGQTSQKIYPLGCLQACGVQSFDDAIVPPDALQETTDYVENLLQNNPSIRIFCWMPPTILLTLYKKNKSLFSSSTMYYYGSFNSRCSIQRQEVTSNEMLQFLNTAFQQVVYFETFFAFGEKNCLTLTENKEFFNFIQQNPMLDKLVHSWNKAIYDECKTSLEKQKEELKNNYNSSLVASIHRLEKIIDVIDANKGYQVVWADVGLAMCLTASNHFNHNDFHLDGGNIFQVEKGIISYDERGMTLFEPNQENGHIFIIKNVDRHALLQDFMKRLLI